MSALVRWYPCISSSMDF